jgi:hypothetical protein
LLSAWTDLAMMMAAAAMLLLPLAVIEARTGRII